MNETILKMMNEDISRCEQATNEESFQLCQTLIAKYKGIIDNFEEDISKIEKSWFEGELNYKTELNVIKEKLQIIIAASHDEDPVYDFKMMINTDLESLKAAISDKNNQKTPEFVKFELYKEVTAKYDSCIPKLGDGLYGYIESCSFYDEVSGDSLFHNLSQIYNKLLSFKSLGYPTISKSMTTSSTPVVQINNTNENKISVDITFNEVRNQIESMSALPDKEISEIIRKINEIEAIVKSNNRKSKKWEDAKEIIKWIADKGFDVGIALLPLLLQIGK